MSKKELTLKKHAAIRKKYDTMAGKTNLRGKRLYTNEYIFDELSAEFFMQISTIEKIIYSRD